jgi:uncharacterized RDD family membrane protein YckC
MENESTEYAGFWIRFVAYIIDAIIISFIEGILIIPLLIFLGYNAAFLNTFSEMQEIDPVVLIPALISAGTGIYLSIFLITWIYYAAMQSGPRQATIGKMALGLIVTDNNGARLSFAKASLRFFSKIISNAIFMIGYIMAGFTARKQALHDIIANTYVIRK